MFHQILQLYDSVIQWNLEVHKMLCEMEMRATFLHICAGEEEELPKLAEHLNEASTAYSKEICAKKTKLMTNNY